MAWIEDFTNEFAKYFDTPDEHLEAVGYFAAGTALANRVFVKSPDEVMTNVYLVLCSPPGWYHKSAPTRNAIRMLRPILGPKEVIPSNPSVEALGKIIPELCHGGIGHGVMVYDEFRSFLTHVRKEYAAPVASLVMEKLERGIPVQFARKKEGGVEIDTIPEGFILSFIASANTPWLLENLRQSDISGGMLSRFLLIEAHEQTRNYELPPPIDDAALRQLGAALQNIRTNYSAQEFMFTGSAARLYSEIYRDIRKKAFEHGHPEYPSLISRAPLYLKKLSLIRAAIEVRGDNKIRAEDVEAASLVIFHAIKASTEIMDEAIATDGIYGKNLVCVRKIIMANERIRKGRLLQLTHLKMRDLDEVLVSLFEQGLIEYERSKDGVFVVWKEPQANGVESGAGETV